MKLRRVYGRLMIGILLFAVAQVCGAEDLVCKSPDGRLEVRFAADAKGLAWMLSKDGKTMVRPSRLGLEFSGLPAFGEFCIVGYDERAADSTWTNRLYRRLEIRDCYNETTVWLEERTAPKPCARPRRLGLCFRAYDEGVAFRYVIPEQPEIPGFQLLRELTEWRFADDPTAWITEYTAHQNSQECPFVHKKLDAVPAESLVGMPLLVGTGGAMLALTEAALSNWAGMFYRVKEGSVCVDLSPLPPSGASTPGVAVIRRTPAESPWRVTMVGADELDLLTKNDIIQNLNPPPEPGLDFSWVKPGASSWDWWVESNNSLSTELTLKLVDFAAEMGWAYHTIDGGWYGFARRPNHGPDVKIECRPHFDLPRIVRHAAEKGVGIFVWLHWEALEDNGIEETFAKFEGWGVKGVKLDFHDRQDQWMVRWFENVCRIAARHRILVNFHGAFKPTGTERTWPNNLTREAVRGNEFNIFDCIVTPDHCATLPFTRFLIGPADFTPGGFGNVFSRDFVSQVDKGHRYGDEADRCPHWAEEQGTRAHAIAQCIQFDSPVMTLCDWPERYRGAAGIEALRGLPSVWKRTIPIGGKCGEWYAVVREAFDGRFYFAVTSLQDRKVVVKLDFLDKRAWRVGTYADDPVRTRADPKILSEEVRIVHSSDVLSFDVIGEGGAVAVFKSM